MAAVVRWPEGQLERAVQLWQGGALPTDIANLISGAVTLPDGHAENWPPRTAGRGRYHDEKVGFSAGGGCEQKRERGNRKRRRCMTCRRPIWSTGPGHRRCAKCLDTRQEFRCDGDWIY